MNNLLDLPSEIIIIISKHNALLPELACSCKQLRNIFGKVINKSGIIQYPDIRVVICLNDSQIPFYGIDTVYRITKCDFSRIKFSSSFEYIKAEWIEIIDNNSVICNNIVKSIDVNIEGTLFKSVKRFNIYRAKNAKLCITSKIVPLVLIPKNESKNNKIITLNPVNIVMSINKQDDENIFKTVIHKNLCEIYSNILKKVLQKIKKKYFIDENYLKGLTTISYPNDLFIYHNLYKVDVYTTYYSTEYVTPIIKNLQKQFAFTKQRQIIPTKNIILHPKNIKRPKIIKYRFHK